MQTKEILEHIMSKDFLGGTLVEYKNGCGFDIEFGRGTITHFISGKDNLVILTNSNASLELEDFSAVKKIREEDGVYHLDIPSRWNYALAGKGVSIPRKANFREMGGSRNN